MVCQHLQVFYAIVILKEEQQLYYLTHSCEETGILKLINRASKASEPGNILS